MNLNSVFLLLRVILFYGCATAGCDSQYLFVYQNVKARGRRRGASSKGVKIEDG